MGRMTERDLKVFRLNFQSDIKKIANPKTTILDKISFKLLKVDRFLNNHIRKIMTVICSYFVIHIGIWIFR